MNVCIECELAVNDWLSTAAAADDDDDVVGWGKFRFHVGVPFNHDINKYFKWLVWHGIIYIKRHWLRGNKSEKNLNLTSYVFCTFFTFPPRDVLQNSSKNFTILNFWYTWTRMNTRCRYIFYHPSEFDKLIDCKSRWIWHSTVI